MDLIQKILKGVNDQEFTQQEKGISSGILSVYRNNSFMC